MRLLIYHINNYIFMNIYLIKEIYFAIHTFVSEYDSETIFKFINHQLLELINT